MQGLVTGLQGLYRPALGVVGDETWLGDGMLISGERRVESHACQYDGRRAVEARNLGLFA